MMKFFRKKQAQRQPRKSCWGKVSTVHKIFSIITSVAHALGILICATLALSHAKGTKYDVQHWRGIAISCMVISIIQLITNVPYIIFWRKSTPQKWAYIMWGAYHLFASVASLVLFFLAFYLVRDYSPELRKSFWSQFKMKIEKNNATMEDMMICIDFVGLNCFFCSFIVLYPTVSKIWNRESPDNINIALS